MGVYHQAHQAHLMSILYEIDIPQYFIGLTRLLYMTMLISLIIPLLNGIDIVSTN